MNCFQSIQCFFLGGAILLGSSLAAAQGNLENPAANAVESGISAISGWHCNAGEIEIEIDGNSLGKAGIGTQRSDTQARCGHIETGFSLLVNYGSLSDGEHTIVVKVDGEVWQERQFSTVRPGADSEFVPQQEHTEYAIDFPKAGDALELQWQASKQSFTVTRSFRNLVNPSRMVSDFNRTFFGHARGYDPARPDRGHGALDETEFSFEITEENFFMRREGTSLGDCDYTGSIEFYYNRVETEGSFNCAGSSGSYTAELFVNPNDGYYIGRFEMTPSGSEEATKDFHMAMAP